MHDKYATEHAKQQAAMAKTQARNQILEQQYQDLLRRKKEEENLTEQEKLMLKEKWANNAKRLHGNKNDTVLIRKMKRCLNVR